MQRMSSRVALGSVLIVVAAACGTATDGETTSTLEIVLAPTASTGTSTTVTTTPTVADATTTAPLSSDYPPEEDEAAPSTSTTSTTGATSTTEATSTTLSGTTTTRLTTTTVLATTTVPAAKTVNVSIVSFNFGPSSVTINVGDTIRWTVNSGTHTTTATGVWNSGATSPGGVFSFTFDQAGTYPYFCSIHPSMQATVTVEG